MSLLLQSTVRSVRAAPLALLTLTASVVVPPGSSVLLAGEMVTVATGSAVTVTVADPTRPSALAEMIAVPIPMAETVPSIATEATAGALLLHDTGRLSVPPAASSTVALSFAVAPIGTLTVAGVTRIDVAGFDTDIVAVPVFPSADAMIVTAPGATAVTTPDDDTVAILVSLLLQLTARPVSSAPVALRTLAESVMLPPGSSVLLDGEMITFATGTAVTVTVAEPTFPSALAAITAVPSPIAVTVPSCDTDATVGAPLLHDTGRLSVPPLASSTVAVSFVVAPRITLTVAGVTRTDVAGLVTEILAVPVLPSAEAVIVAEPGAIAVTTPDDDTLATLVSLLLQSTARSERSEPLALCTLATSVVLPPGSSVLLDGEIVTVATGTAATVTVAEPTRPSALARMTAVPTPTPVTVPSSETDATVGAPLLHDTGRSSDAPSASSTVAVSFAVDPMNTFTIAGATRIVAAGVGVTVTGTVADLPSLVTVIVVDPAATAVTVPSVATVAIAALALLKLTARPDSTVPFASVTNTLSLVPCPGMSDSCDGETTRLLTGRLATDTAAVAVRPSIVAVIVAEPAAMAITWPDDDTVAIDGAFALHVIVRPLST